MTSRYVGRRLLSSAVVVGVVLVLVFFVTHLLGDPVRIALPPTATQEQIDALRTRLGLDDPLATQFLRFLQGAASGTFGESFWQREPAMGLVLERVPATIYLAVAAMVIIVPIGIVAGVVAAVRPSSLAARAVNVLSFVGASMVDFWIALMLILVFAVHLDWLPTSGFGGIDHVILPALTLAIIGTGALAQVTRVSVAEELGKSHVAAARARGVGERDVILGYALRNALVPILTLGGSVAIGLLNGAIIAEAVFGWPGIGQLMVQAIQHRDLPLIEATVFFTALLVTGLNLAVDLAYGVVNPRLRTR